MSNRDKFYFVSVNLLKEKHKDLIEWIKEESSDMEMSISSFCVFMLKKMKQIQEDDNAKKTDD